MASQEAAHGSALKRRPGRARAAWRWVVLIALFVTLLLVSAWAWTVRDIHREAPPLSAQEADDSFRRSVAWLKTHEPQVLQDGNAALWWMVDVAAKRSQDPFLQQLVERYLAQTFQGVQAQSPWLRLVRPGASVTSFLPTPVELSEYQRYFLAAATCQPEDERNGPPSGYLQNNLCRPMVAKVLLGDRVCSTHQVFGLLIHQRNHCAQPSGMPRLQQELLADIQTQARLDPFMRDATVQRVLILAWVGGADLPPARWVRRVHDAQQSDGGWTGDAQLPEWPEFVQPRTLKKWLRASLGQAEQPTVPSDFHATAQGLLLMALYAHPSDTVTAGID